MESNYALTKLFHPSGAQISIPLDLNGVMSVETGKSLLASVDNLITAGFVVNVPGLEEGELVEDISAVARREGSDQTPILDFYSSNTRLEKKFIHVYLNTPDDVTAFEQATGLKLDQLTTYDGKTAIERTDRNAPKYIKPLPSPIKLVFRISPKWEKWKQEGGEGQEPHKRLLVRYEVNHKPVATEPGNTTIVGTADATDTSAHLVTDLTASNAQAGQAEKQYPKLDGTLITMIVKKTGLKPTVISPILAKVEGTISFPSALKLIESNLNKETQP